MINRYERGKLGLNHIHSNSVIYEGKYLKGEKNGKGKEYYTDISFFIFIGKKKWYGKICFYYNPNEVIYEKKMELEKLKIINTLN